MGGMITDQRGIRMPSREDKISHIIERLIETAQITDSDDFGDGSKYEVWLDAHLWNALEVITGQEASHV